VAPTGCTACAEDCWTVIDGGFSPSAYRDQEQRKLRGNMAHVHVERIRSSLRISLLNINDCESLIITRHIVTTVCAVLGRIACTQCIDAAYCYTCPT